MVLGADDGEVEDICGVAQIGQRVSGRRRLSRAAVDGAVRFQAGVGAHVEENDVANLILGRGRIRVALRRGVNCDHVPIGVVAVVVDLAGRPGDGGYHDDVLVGCQGGSRGREAHAPSGRGVVAEAERIRPTAAIRHGVVGRGLGIVIRDVKGTLVARTVLRLLYLHAEGETDDGGIRRLGPHRWISVLDGGGDEGRFQFAADGVGGDHDPDFHRRRVAGAHGHRAGA